MQAGAKRSKGVGKALFAAAEYLKVDAQISLTTASQSAGGHVPSLPGQAPNQDTGVLGDNIKAYKISDGRSIVTSEAEYSDFLEFGTSKMAARPFMKPALDRVKPILDEYIDEAMRRAGEGKNG